MPLKQALVYIDYTEDSRVIMIRNAGEDNDFRFGKTGRVKQIQADIRKGHTK